MRLFLMPSLAAALMASTAFAQAQPQSGSMPFSVGRSPSVVDGATPPGAAQPVHETATYSGEGSDEMQIPPVQEQGGVSFISGGVGLGERDALARAGASYPLKIEMAERGGEYVSDAVVTFSKNGMSPVSFTTEGPLAFVRLAPGTYQVEVQYGGQTKRQSVTVGASGQRRLFFYW